MDRQRRTARIPEIGRYMQPLNMVIDLYWAMTLGDSAAGTTERNSKAIERKQKSDLKKIAKELRSMKADAAVIDHPQQRRGDMTSFVPPNFFRAARINFGAQGHDSGQVDEVVAMLKRFGFASKPMPRRASNDWRGDMTMDKQRVARELVRLAKELTAAIKVREFDDSKGHRWVFDDGMNIGWVKEIEGPGIPLYRILVTVEELGSTFKYKRQLKSQKEAAKIVSGILKALAFEGGGGVVMRDWSKVASRRRQA